MTNWGASSKTRRELDSDESGTGQAMARHLQAIREDAQADIAYARTYEGQLASLQRHIAGLRHDQADSGADHAAKIARLEAEREALVSEHTAAAEAAFAAEWTREVTVQRRAAWNAMVQGGQFSRHGKVWMPYVREQERKQGWDMGSLKRAVDTHGL